MPIATFSDDTSPEKCRKSFILKQFQDSAKGGTVQTALHFPFVLCNLRRKMGPATPRLVWLWLLCIFNGVQAMIFKRLFSEKVFTKGWGQARISHCPDLLSWILLIQTQDQLWMMDDIVKVCSPKNWHCWLMHPFWIGEIKPTFWRRKASSSMEKVNWRKFTFFSFSEIFSWHIWHILEFRREVDIPCTKQIEEKKFLTDPFCYLGKRRQQKSMCKEWTM